MSLRLSFRSRNQTVFKNGLGDVVCIEGDCEIGKALVNEMLATYKHYFNNLGEKEFLAFHDKFGSAVNSIREAYQKAESSWTRKVPFSPVCCTIKTLGNQAQGVTRDMNKWTGAASPGTVDTQGPTAKAGSILLWVAGLAAGGFILLTLLDRRERSHA